MLALLRGIGSFADPQVFNVLRRLARKSPSPVIELVAEEILTHLAKRHAIAEPARMARPEERADRGESGYAPG